jgi:hypothetical protein
MITETNIAGLTQPMIQARVDSIDAKPFLYGVHFPVKKITGLSWRMLEDQAEHLNVAADVRSLNSTTPRKSRPAFDYASGDIPPISIGRELDERDLMAYHTALALAQSKDAVSMIEFWGKDVDFCFRGVQSELDYIAWKLASNAGVLEFTTTNNATFATEYNLDYNVDDEMKIKSSVDWGKKDSADIIGDLARAVKLSKKKGFSPRYAFVSLELFYKIATSDQIVKLCSPVKDDLFGVKRTPSVQQVNEMLYTQANLNKIQLIVVDQDITRELKNGVMETGNPFEDNRLVLSQSPILGSTQYDLPKEKTSNILRATRAHTVVKKYGVEDPYTEVTLGQAYALPVLDSAYRNVYLRTDAKDW